MKTAVIVVNYNTPDMVVTCLSALAQERAGLPGLRAIVVDNASPDGSAAILATRLAEPAYADWAEFMPLSLNGGFGWGNNQAILKLLQGSDPPEAILLLNPDAVIEPGAVAALVRDMAARPDAGAIGSQMINPDGSLAGSAFRFPTVGSEFVRGLGIAGIGRLLGIRPTMVPFGEVGPVEWLTGASVLLRAAALRQCGLFDTGFFLYFEEVELLRRFTARGWKCYHCPGSRVLHVAGASTGVLDGSSRAGRVPPDYVFASRKRYFALTRGRAVALVAEFAWLAGATLGQVLGLFRRKWRSADVGRERAALLRLGLSVPGSAASPAICPIDEIPGQRPAWM